MAVKNNLKLIFNYFILNIKKEYQYKVSFWTQIFMMILNDAFFVLQWVIIFQIVDNIGGYGFNESLLLWGVSAGSYGISHTFFAGIYEIKDLIYDGKMDVYLTQPKNVLINVGASSIKISAIGDTIYSFIILAVIGSPWWWYFALIPVMILTGILFSAVYVTYVSIAFYVKRGDAIAKSVESTIMKADKYPPVIYDTLVKGLLLTVLPAFFFTFIPVQYIFLTFNIWYVLLFVAVIIVWTIIAFKVFNKGLRKYNSGSLMGGRL